jgi:hypothetical protein
LVIVIYCISILLLNLYWEDWYYRFKKWYTFTYTLIEYSSFTYLLFINIQNKKIKLFILIISFLFVGFLYFFNFAHTNIIDSIPIGAETLILLVISFYFFYEQFKNPVLLYLYSHYCFWITIGILIYLCGSLFIYLRGASITQVEKNQFWFLTYVFEIIKNILFGVAIIVLSRKPGQKTVKKDIPYLDIKELYND